MEKISSIVKSSYKSNVDLSKERPVRAGAPTFGQPVSKATNTFEKVQKENEFMSSNAAPVLQSATEKQSLIRHADIVDRVTLSFHKKPEALSQPEVEDFNSESFVSIDNNEPEEGKEKVISIYV